jgi:hypothetical protein
MVDAYRFVLALCVVQGHSLVRGSSWLAWQAVFSFYVLTGSSSRSSADGHPSERRPLNIF